MSSYAPLDELHPCAKSNEAAMEKSASVREGYIYERQALSRPPRGGFSVELQIAPDALPLSSKRYSPRELLLLLSMMLISTPLFLLYWLPSSLSTPAPTNLTNQDWIPKTQAAVDTLQKWYNEDTGLWETTNWWNAANILTMLGNFALLNPAFKPQFERIAQTTHTKAPGFKGQILKVRTPTSMDTYTYPNIPPGLQAPPLVNNNYDFLNWYYDDEGWWALAWLKAYDVTNQTIYLKEAITIFDDMINGYNATCGGIWWNKGHEANVAISNELFLAVAAQLANRVEAWSRKFYVNWVRRHWAWFRTAGFINEEGNVNDGLDLATCKNNNGTVWSYNQGVILGALTEAYAIDEYLAPASRFVYKFYVELISYNAFQKLQDDDGIIHDACEPNCGNDGPQFKGIFMRNLQAAGRSFGWDYGTFAESRAAIVKNAASIWAKDRNEDDKLGLVWSGPYMEASAATQSSALDALVAAIDAELHAHQSYAVTSDTRFLS
ncbi:MAG: hypothetical protein Q9195_002520 [Heterodermia aff. obscurata]